MFNRTEVILNNVLRPETVIALENVRFTQRAKALPGVLDAGESITEVFLSGDNPDEETIDVRREMRIEPDHEERQIELADYVVIGGLCYDRDCSHLDPFGDEGNANGKLYHASSRIADRAEVANYYAALGLEADGDKDYSTDAVCDRLAKRVMNGIGADLSLFSRLIHRLRATGRKVSKASLAEVVQHAIDQEGWQCALNYLVQSLYGVRYFDRLSADLQDALQPLADLFSEAEVEAAWDDARDAGELGNPNAVLIDIYEHGGRSYSVTGSGMQCRWDTSRGAAVWVPDGDAMDNIRYSVFEKLGVGQVRWFGDGSAENPSHARYSLNEGETWVGEGQAWSWSKALDAMLQASGKKIQPAVLQEAIAAESVQYCKSILEEYNSWVNGDVHGVVVYVIDRATGERLEEHDDECWGYIGSAYAESELEAAVLAKALELGATKH